ncbi:hypothetical protein E2C01_018573 [Portunus trituberculatus]|uniref:Uncharacterized protein n=1 Tax=Portunus trituberculatus TaxID=210409 RepID=A0A5B7DVL3_PORTR|nr:hypothetical protein [Portunus trituberculatus]
MSCCWRDAEGKAEWKARQAVTDVHRALPGTAEEHGGKQGSPVNSARCPTTGQHRAATAAAAAAAHQYFPFTVISTT